MMHTQESYKCGAAVMPMFLVMLPVRYWATVLLPIKLMACHTSSEWWGPGEPGDRKGRPFISLVTGILTGQYWTTALQVRDEDLAGASPATTFHFRNLHG